MAYIALEVDPALWFLLSPRRRRHRFTVEVPGTDTVGHVVRMVGIPPTEIGAVRLDGRVVDLGTRPTAASGADGDVPGPVLALGPRQRPQPTRQSPPRFLLDVHLRSLTRRLRLLGLDAAWEADAEDAHLVHRAAREERVLLTRDRGLLHRGALTEGALVRGERADGQLDDVLDRFDPPLAPWTRCLRCGAPLEEAGSEDVAEQLLPRTRQAYRAFSRCTGCGRAYWRGAHAGPLDAVVTRALAARRPPA
ncbi:Mut7-C RNAse domain-containing protein [Kocuria sabuli]|uniref:Mut7-C RNAse domain-containing protein n=1 Tax=Kocuria sabuli TaxID=3071448 RepID=UPI0034D46D97